MIYGGYERSSMVNEPAYNWGVSLQVIEATDLNVVGKWRKQRHVQNQGAFWD